MGAAEDAQPLLVEVAADVLGAGVVQRLEDAVTVEAGEGGARAAADEADGPLRLGDGLLDEQQLAGGVEEDAGRPAEALIVEPQLVLLPGKVVLRAEALGEDARAFWVRGRKEEKEKER